jgi:hypothetical protein
MLQTSTRGEYRRAKRLKESKLNPPTLFETHPNGNRRERRMEAKLQRTMMQRLRKEGVIRHRLNTRANAIEGHRIRMERIAKKRADRK